MFLPGNHYSEAGELLLLNVPRDTCTDWLMGRVGPGVWSLALLGGHPMSNKLYRLSWSPEMRKYGRGSNLDCRNRNNKLSAFCKTKDFLIKYLATDLLISGIMEQLAAIFCLGDCKVNFKGKRKTESTPGNLLYAFVLFLQQLFYMYCIFSYF